MNQSKIKLIDYNGLSQSEKKILLQLIIDVHTDNSDCKELYYNKEDEFIPPDKMADIVLGGV